MSGTQETALTLARELSGAGEAEEALLELLCQAAEQQWEKRLRPGMTAEDCGKGLFRERDYTSVDAMITDTPDIPLRRGLHRRRGPGGGAGR